MQRSGSHETTLSQQEWPSSLVSTEGQCPFVISDLDALRATYGLKGSAGIKPCLWCQNILKKNSSLHDDHFREIHEHDSSKFEIATNESLWAMCDHLQERMPHMNQETRGRMEKSMGVSYIPGSILFDQSVLSKLPPSDVCLDSMHNYFSNGVCSYELGQFWDAVVKATPLTLESLFQACREAEWQGPRVSKHGAACYMKSLWSEKMWSPEQFKGQAEQCESIMPLMRWYAEMFLSHVCIFEQQTGEFARVVRYCAKSFENKHTCGDQLI